MTAAVRRMVESAELLGSVFVAKSMIHIAPFQIPSKDHLSTMQTSLWLEQALPPTGLPKRGGSFGFEDSAKAI